MSATGASGPPYPPKTASLGGIPSNSVDTPICAVFLVLFLTSAISNIVIFKTNLGRGHKFLISIFFIGFSMMRVLTCILRIVWANRLHNVSVAIAAGIFTNVGVFALYVINLLFAQRIFRARRPHIAWYPAFKVFLIAAYVCLALVAALVVSFTVIRYYTRKPSLLTASRDVTDAAQTYLQVFVVLPYIALIAAYATPASATRSPETFGHSSVHKKTIILLVLTTIMTLEQSYKYGVNWMPTSRPPTNPPWYDSKTCFYTFGFMLEIIYLYTALSVRVDRRFHVPNGSSKRKSYATPADEKEVDGLEHS